ncbi:hypothetical protein NQ317_007522, partial [Molorchus minor]
INMKGLVHHLPTDEDIANILKEFTVDFLLKGYGTLVHDLHSQLLANIHLHIDTSHFFWLVTYFFKFATQLELDPEHISPVLSSEIFSYLIFQGVWICEELEISYAIPDIDLKPCLRRLHLVVTAIREFLQGIETYQRMIHLSDNDREMLLKLQEHVCKLKDLKLLFVLLLRQFNPNIQSKQYLQDLILTNHNFLLFLDNASTNEHDRLNIMDHLKEFATVEIMRQYGLLLENFKENGEFVNNCIFTMMHHIGGDLRNVPTLFQPSILKTFSQIWETDYELCDDWSDLIEYVIHKFINTPGTHYQETNNKHISTNDVEDLTESDLLSSSSDEKSEYNSFDEITMLFRWTEEERENLKYYNQSRRPSDTITKISKRWEQSSMRHKTQLAELLQQNIIDVNECDLKKDTKQTDQANENMEHSVEDAVETEEDKSDKNIKMLKERLCMENKKKYLIWLQSVLLETCYVKMILNNPEQFKDCEHISEPTTHYFALLNLPIPIVPWTTEQANIFKHKAFVLLLHKLGFYLPADTGKIFVRMPNFWTADHIFSIAQQLGAINQASLKFDVNKLNGESKCNQAKEKSQSTTPFYGPGKFSMADIKKNTFCCTLHSPVNRILQNGSKNILEMKISAINMVRAQQISSTSELSIAIPDVEVITCDLPPPELTIAKEVNSNRRDSLLNMECLPIHEIPDHLDDLERNSNSDTASVASNLTRMYVSDEEGKMTLTEKDNKIT